MELILPAITLGGLAWSSFMNRDKEVEGFNGVPLEIDNDSRRGAAPIDGKTAERMNSSTAKYFNQNVYQLGAEQHHRQGQIIPQGLTVHGSERSAEHFQHSNMIPFNGGKIHGQQLYNAASTEQRLDSLVGTGYYFREKQAQPAMFKPLPNMSYPNGSPNITDFLQSRVNPSTRAHSVLPFEQIRVGPGINQSDLVAGSGGYNSGLFDRDSYRDKTVDELRIATNPKLENTLDGLEGPAGAYIKSIGTKEMFGHVERNGVDPTRFQTQAQWLITTGSTHAPMVNPDQINKEQARQFTEDFSYLGPANKAEFGEYVDSDYSAPRRFDSVNMTERVGPSNATAHGYDQHRDTKQGYSSGHGIRAETGESSFLGAVFNRAVGAVIAPLQDMLRPTRKEETASVPTRNIDQGYVNKTGSYYYNENEMAPTTTKETTLYTPDTYINNSNLYVGGYDLVPVNTYENQRDTTTREYFGNTNGVASNYAMPSTEQYANQTNNDAKEATILKTGRMNMGNQDHLNHVVNLSTLPSDATRGYFGGATLAYSLPSSTEVMGRVRAPTNSYDNQKLMERNSPEYLSALKTNPYVISINNMQANQPVGRGIY